MKRNGRGEGQLLQADAKACEQSKMTLVSLQAFLTLLIASTKGATVSVSFSLSSHQS